MKSNLKAEQPVLFTLAEGSTCQKTKWDELQDMCEVAGKEGGLIPAGVASELLGFSRARMYELVEMERFQSWKFFGKLYVSAGAVRAFGELDRRKAGRPWKAMAAAVLP